MNNLLLNKIAKLRLFKCVDMFETTFKNKRQLTFIKYFMCFHEKNRPENTQTAYITFYASV